MASLDSLPSDDYYAILNLPRTATVDDVRHAYRTLGPAVHPDKLHHTLSVASVTLPPTYPLASTFHRVQRAAAVLSDPLTRWAWDEYGEEGVRVAEKLRVRLAWRTEHSARDCIARAVKANRQRSGADEQMDEDETDEDSDATDSSRTRRRRQRLGAGLLSLQSLSSSTRVVYSLNAYSLFGYRHRAMSPVVSQIFALPFNKPLPYYTFDQHTAPSHHPSALSPLPLLLASSSLRHAVDVRLSDTVTLNTAVEVTRKGGSGTVGGALSMGVQRRWRSWVAGLQAVTSTNSGSRSKRGLSASCSYNVTPLMQLEMDSGYEWKGGVTQSLWPQSTFSVHRAFDSSTHTAASMSLSPLAVSSVDCSFSSPLLGWRTIEQEVSCSADGQKLALEERLSYHLDTRKRMKVYLKVALSIPHKLSSISPQSSASSPLSPPTQAPSAAASGAFTFGQFEPSLTIGSQYTPSPSHSIGLWLSAAHRGVMAGVSYRFTSFSLTLPLHLTPQYDNKAMAAGLLLPFGLLIASRAAWLWHERRRRQRDWQRHLTPKAQRVLAGRLALRAHLLSFRRAARTSRRQQRHSGGLIIVYARWTWSDEGAVDDTMIGSVDVRDALQARLDSDGRLRLDRAADLIRSGRDETASVAAEQEQGTLYVRWRRRDGKEREREWKDDAAVFVGDDAEGDSEVKQNDDEAEVGDDWDVFW